MTMTDELMTTFEKLWITHRAQWCDNHNLDGARAFSHDRVKIAFFHRVAQVNVDEERVDGLIDEALRLFQDKSFDCAFTLSPLDHPIDLGERLEGRGFTRGILASAMVYDHSAEQPPMRSAAKVALSDESEYDIWADVMCRSFGHPLTMGEVGRSVLIVPEVRRYLARVDGAPAGTTLLYSQFGMGYIDLVGTLPEHRRKGVASALVTWTVADSQALGNRWTTLEAETGSDAERLYKQLGIHTAYHRHRYIKSA